MVPVFHIYFPIILGSYSFCNFKEYSFFFYFYVDWYCAIDYTQCLIRNRALGFGYSKVYESLYSN